MWDSWDRAQILLTLRSSPSGPTALDTGITRKEACLRGLALWLFLRSSIFAGCVPKKYIHLHLIFCKILIYLFLEKWEGREKDRERNISWLSLAHAPTRERACNPDVCPDGESNHLQDDGQPAEPLQSGPSTSILILPNYQIRSCGLKPKNPQSSLYSLFRRRSWPTIRAVQLWKNLFR